MQESWSAGELSQEVQTQQRDQSPGRGHLSSYRPTQPSAPQAVPAPFRPADPPASKLVTQFLFCQAGLRHIFPVHLPLGSVLIFPEGRVVEGAGSAPGSDPLGPVQSILTLDTLYPPIPQGRSVLGTSPACCALRGRAPHLPLAPQALSHPRLLAGAEAGSRRGKRDLKRGVPVPVPPASRSPRLAPAAAAAPAPCPPSATIAQPGSAQAPGPLVPVTEGNYHREKRREGRAPSHSLPPSSHSAQPWRPRRV